MQFLKEIRSTSDVIRLIKQYQQIIVFAAATLGLVAGGVTGYFYYKSSRDEKAYRAMVNVLEYVDGHVKAEGEKQETEQGLFDRKEFATSQEKWEKVASVSKAAYESFSSSSLAPVLLAYHADALVRLGKLQDAIPLIQVAVAKTKNKSVRAFYEVKLALMQIDANDGKGLVALQALAANDKGAAHDHALYRLGEYYWYAHDFAQARNYWNQLVLKYGKSTQYPSPWAEVAIEKLRLIDSDIE